MEPTVVFEAPLACSVVMGVVVELGAAALVVVAFVAVGALEVLVEAPVLVVVLVAAAEPVAAAGVPVAAVPVAAVPAAEVVAGNVQSVIPKAPSQPSLLLLMLQISSAVVLQNRMQKRPVSGSRSSTKTG